MSRGDYEALERKLAATRAALLDTAAGMNAKAEALAIAQTGLEDAQWRLGELRIQLTAAQAENAELRRELAERGSPTALQDMFARLNDAEFNLKAAESRATTPAERKVLEAMARTGTKTLQDLAKMWPPDWALTCALREELARRSEPVTEAKKEGER